MKIETYEEAVKASADQVKEAMEADCLDPELYDILIDLNTGGYFTFDSCAGHNRGDGARGNIWFAGPALRKRSGEVESLLWLLAKHGLEDVRLEVKSGHTVATFAAIGSQYWSLRDNHPEDFDFADDVPPRPEKCETCGESDFWLQGDPYDYTDTLEWMCKHCQPKPFNSDAACLTSEIVKRREELPKLKLWEVEDQEIRKTFQMRAKNQYNIYKRLGVSPYDNDCEVFIRRVK